MTIPLVWTRVPATGAGWVVLVVVVGSTVVVVLVVVVERGTAVEEPGTVVVGEVLTT